MRIPQLFPAPREVRSFDPALEVLDAPELRPDPSLPAQGYELVLDAEGARLAHADEAGRRYGLSTLEQLRRADGSLPGVHVLDAPDVPVRGYLLDVSRDRVPTRAALERLVEVLATCRYNHLQLYVEHTFAYRDHRSVWADASPITHEDLEWLDQRCADAGIELAANQNCFGHLAPWLARPEYRDRAECPDGFELLPGVRMPPAVLEPTARNAELVVSLAREQLSCLRGSTVNVGCDETFELGRGRSRERVAQVGLGTVYGEHLRRIVGPLLDDGASVQFWGDVVANHPSVLEHLPEGDLTPLVWNYEGPDAPPVRLPAPLDEVLASIGIDLTAPTDFGSILEPFTRTGRPFWVAPGTSTWNSVVGRLPNATANLLDAATAAVATGAVGYLVTDWGDNGHHQPPAVSLPPIAYGGAVSWCAATNHDLDLAGVVDAHLVDDPTGTIGSVLERIGSVGAATGMTARNASPLFHALVPSAVLMVTGSADRDAVRGVVADLERARGDLARARPAAGDGLVEQLDVAIGLALVGAQRLLDPAAASTELADLVRRYRSAWLASSRPGGLDASAARLSETLPRPGSA